MVDLPRISVIIPTLQEEKLLERTLSQFTPEIRQRHWLEVIVSDGGSTDQTLAIAQRLADVVIENNDGIRQNISIGRNAGAKKARGNILLFINADTLIDKIDNFFNEISGSVDQDRVSGATCNVCVHAEEETFADVLFHTIYNWYFYLLNVIGMGMGRGECQAVRRELFFSVGGYKETIAAGEDFELFVRLRRKGKIAFLRTLRVRESPRRYRKYGYVYISLTWFVNAIAVLLFRRSVATEWKPIR